MTTLVLTLGLDPDRSPATLERLRAEVAPWLRRLPGFVTSRWLLGTERDHCTVVIDIAEATDPAEPADEDRPTSVEVIRKALEARTADPARSWWCERVEVADDLHLAERPTVAM
ncbi:hypothetical protein ACFQ0K_12115 [Nocardioides caeni]|uniref:ABM domain-containing protein n=1 Tax=Nocardioides caeni TaxID=574700 RepID=A0A4V4HLD9_9ACTN|nr:hypothetical protein [Nocardioides caeni]THV17816.1 hypothetical protein E9934_04955 [Nocardioides caeni]